MRVDESRYRQAERDLWAAVDPYDGRPPVEPVVGIAPSGNGIGHWVASDDGLVVIASDCVGPLPEYFEEMDLPEDFGPEREELLREGWGSSAAWQSPATVTEHVRRLRRKLTGAFTVKAIRISSAIRPWKMREKKARKAYCQRLPGEIIRSIVSCGRRRGHGRPARIARNRAFPSARPSPSPSITP